MKKIIFFFFLLASAYSFGQGVRIQNLPTAGPIQGHGLTTLTQDSTGANGAPTKTYKLSMDSLKNYLGTGWGLTGTSGTNPGANYIGTSDAHGMSFATDGTRYAYVDSAQDIYIDGDAIQISADTFALLSGSGYLTAGSTAGVSIGATGTHPSVINLNGLAGTIQFITGTGSSSFWPTADASGALTNDGYGNLSWAGPVQIPHSVNTVAGGSSLNLSDNTYNIIIPSGMTPSINLVLPSSPANNDVIELKFTSPCTISYSGGTISSAFGSASSGSYFKLVYDTATSSWN